MAAAGLNFFDPKFEVLLALENARDLLHCQGRMGQGVQPLTKLLVLGPSKNLGQSTGLRKNDPWSKKTHFLGPVLGGPGLLFQIQY